jgi:hypothetical protein
MTVSWMHGMIQETVMQEFFPVGEGTREIAGAGGRTGGGAGVAGEKDCGEMTYYPSVIFG